MEQVLGYAGMPLPDRSSNGHYPASGLCFYTNHDRVWKNVPPDAFAGAGAGNQVFVGMPSLDLVVVRNGELIDTAGGEAAFWRGIENCLLDPLMAALERASAIAWTSSMTRG